MQRLSPLLAFSVILSTSIATAQGTLTLAEIERRAFAQNPTIVQADAQVTAADERAVQAGRWPNPTGAIRRRRSALASSFVEASTESLSSRCSRRAADSVRIGTCRAGKSTKLKRFGRRSGRVCVTPSALCTTRRWSRRIEVRAALSSLSDEAVSVSVRLVNVGAAD